LAATSRDTVDGERPKRDAIDRIDSPAANPREISSRSVKDNRNGDRHRGFGAGCFNRFTARRIANLE
jgi:hypothetical protein